MPLPATLTSATADRRTTARHGFSLVELLVVLGIIAAMTGLVLGGLFRSRDGNRLLAAEQVLADAIRQARHTARSTAAPVELRLTPVVNGSEVTGARLAGVSRTVLWSETFDKERDSNDDGVIDEDDLGTAPLPAAGEPANGVVLGRSGNGRQPSELHPIPVQILPRGATIVRAGRSDGFYLSCSVRPPRIQGLTSQHVPLVMIGPDDSPDYEAGQCGLWLLPISHKLQDGDGPRGEQAHIVSWELSGWVRDDSGQAVQVFAAAHQLQTRIAREQWGNGNREFSHPITGGEWVDAGLLYDGRQLALYLNGRRIAVRRDGVPARLLADCDHIHIGDRLVAGTPPTIEYAAVAIDDVRLYRLGTADLSELPGNVVLVSALGAAPSATIGWRILCQPDGRVEVHRDDDSDPRAINDRVQDITQGPRTGDTATILLGQLRAPGTIQNAELMVTLDGRVQSRLVTSTPGGGAVP
jgi:prepilin-type N-terminal cleavage/methylation domain-containing protein